jgi:hypothetical protein
MLSAVCFLGAETVSLIFSVKNILIKKSNKMQLYTVYFIWNTVRFIKSRRIAWLGHVMQMDDKRTPKRILPWKPTGTRTRGRPRKRWIAGTEEDLQIMGVRRWRKQCEERAEWRKIAEKAKAYSGL